MADDELPFAVLEWDSHFFGRRIARVTRELPTRSALDDALQLGRAHGIDCLYYLVDPSSQAADDAVQAAGFGLIDVRLTLEAPTRLDQAASAATRRAEAADVPVLQSIAREGHRDARFHSDRRFSREQSDALYATWIERSVLDGFADQVLTLDVEGVPAGYVTCSRQSDGTGSIGLFALAEQARGRGLGQKLLAAALDWLAQQGSTQVSVVTQGRSAAAQRVYQRLGFVTRDAQLWYHLWLEGESTTLES